MANVIHERFRIDPHEFSVNIRFKGGHTVPPGTRKRMTEIRDRMAEKAADEGFSVGPTDYIAADFTFAFGSWRPDLDNPTKRVLDALSEGLGFNDNRVVRLCLFRQTVGVGNQYIDVTLTLVPQSEVSSPIGAKRPTGRPIWVG